MNVDYEIPLTQTKSSEDVKEDKDIISLIQIELHKYVNFKHIIFHHMNDEFDKYDKNVQEDSVSVPTSLFETYDAIKAIKDLLQYSNWVNAQSIKHARDNIVYVEISSSIEERRKVYELEFYWIEDKLSCTKQYKREIIDYHLFLFKIKKPLVKAWIITVTAVVIAAFCVICIWLPIYASNHPRPDHSWEPYNCNPMTNYVNETCFNGNLYNNK